MAEKKRDEPDLVPPVVIDGIRYEAPHLGGEVDERQDGGVVAAFDDRTGRLIWTVVVYTVEPDPDMEEDKQDVFIKSMVASRNGSKLYIVNELGQKFRLDLKTRKVSKVWFQWL